MEEQLRKIEREQLVSINREAGCIDVSFLEPNAEDGNPYFGVVSLWAERETLLVMKKSEQYQRLLEALKPLEADSSDSVFTAG